MCMGSIATNAFNLTHLLSLSFPLSLSFSLPLFYSLLLESFSTLPLSLYPSLFIYLSHTYIYIYIYPFPMSHSLYRAFPITMHPLTHIVPEYNRLSHGLFVPQQVLSLQTLYSRVSCSSSVVCFSPLLRRKLSPLQYAVLIHVPYRNAVLCL